MAKRQKIREDNLQLILSAAEEEFGLHGYKGTAIQNIADRAGLPKANIVYYFASKENLYKAVLNKIISAWNDVFEKATAEDDPAAVLDALIRRKVQQSIDNPRASRIFAMEIIQGAPHHKDYLRKELRQWVRERAAVIETWITQGRMRAVDPVHLIFMIWSTTQHYADFEAQVLTVMNRAEYEPEDVQAIADTLSGIILRGCGLEPPAHKA
ncbi:TetR/AcrR family transcriptional regulator [Marinospirillum alkaliphilum]|uniref:Transcriptional regulator, TetR family n=1 Tax=Marinospirillum alkaliphilum DSM 21637 TaxID=1122209 RepID=A0A1K1YK98_9GAMM|nr:TetR/AcrR family transcriptional regulator [Marinospirillum alkaliphilum]SFX61859.1 transcriptional regulator, TetR family [Marinospirillum alkaliphilum DSM 21637]